MSHLVQVAFYKILKATRSLDRAQSDVAANLKALHGSLQISRSFRVNAIATENVRERDDLPNVDG